MIWSKQRKLLLRTFSSGAGVTDVKLESSRARAEARSFVQWLCYSGCYTMVLEQWFSTFLAHGLFPSLPKYMRTQVTSAAWRSGSERRFYDENDRKVNGSTPNLVSLLRPWIRCFTMIISAWWSLASSK